MQEKSNFIICNPNEYKLTYEALAPDRRIRQVIYNIPKFKNGYIHNKKNLEDDSYYAPYLMYKMGQKTGVNVPETELGIVVHIDRDYYYYRDSFFESSIVYDENLGAFESLGVRNLRTSQVSQEVVFDTYLMENPDIAEKRKQEMLGRAMPMTIDDYVNSNIYYLTTRGNKPRYEYSKTEIDAMKQELIDRALFGLKFGTNGNFDVTLFDNQDARLDPYYLSNSNLYSLNVNEYWINSQLEKEDQEFKKAMDSEYSVQYGIKPNTEKPTVEEMLNYIFENYPEQAEKSYKKLSKYNLKDFEAELENCDRMSEAHKKFAIRAFGIREKVFEQLYRQHTRYQIK